jgi:hypothetical protein
MPNVRVTTARSMGIAAVAIALQGCTTYLYKGPTRPSSEVAVITSNDTIVDRADDARVRESASGSFARLEVLPGPHWLGISLNRVTPGLFVTNVARSNDVGVCVRLEAGHIYQTDAATFGGLFTPVVTDLTAGRYAPRCRTSPPKPPTAPAPLVEAPPQVPDHPVAPAAQSAAESPTEPADTPNAADHEASAAGIPRAPHTPATDLEEPIPARPVRDRMPAHERLSSEAVLANRPPGNGLSLVFGGAFGGEDFVKATNSQGDTESLSSGSGVIVGVGAMLTPLWVAEAAGFGLGLDAAVKYDHLGASNGSASITRFPVSLTAHVLLNVSDYLHFIIFKGGVVRDFDVNYSASGFTALDVNVTGTWGPTGAIGYYKRSNDVFGWDILAFFAITKHQIGPDQINADSLGVSIGLHWLP